MPSNLLLFAIYRYLEEFLDNLELLFLIKNNSRYEYKDLLDIKYDDLSDEYKRELRIENSHLKFIGQNASILASKENIQDLFIKACTERGFLGFKRIINHAIKLSVKSNGIKDTLNLCESLRSILSMEKFELVWESEDLVSGVGLKKINIKNNDILESKNNTDNLIKSIIFIRDGNRKTNRVAYFYINGDVNNQKRINNYSNKVRRLAEIVEKRELVFDKQLYDYINLNKRCVLYCRGKFDLTKILERSGKGLLIKNRDVEIKTLYLKDAPSGFFKQKSKRKFT